VHLVIARKVMVRILENATKGTGLGVLALRHAPPRRFCLIPFPIAISVCAEQRRRLLPPIVRLSAGLLPGTLLRESLLYALLLAGLQIEGMPLHFLDDVFGLDLPLKSTEKILYRFAFL
jgi:hypothetical protein